LNPEDKGSGGETPSDRPADDASKGRRSRRSLFFAWAGLLVIVLVVGVLVGGPLGLPGSALGFGIVKSQENGAYYFRLQAHYTHAAEPIDFDIVVACSIHVTHHRGGNSGFLASRYPLFFVQRTRDNHAVMQIVPIACRGETTESGVVPEDFLPGAIWFDTPGDYRIGIAYFSEDAFESPNSQLKFHGASIQTATRAEWEAFGKRAADNEGLRSRYYDRPDYWTGDAQRIADGGGKEIEAAYARACHGVIRYRLSDTARALVRKYWPTDKPRFWVTSNRDGDPFRDLMELERHTPIFTDGIQFTQHLTWGNYEYGGFPTRSGGGMMWSYARKIAPAEIFPSRSDRGIPWVFTDEVAKSRYLTKDVEVRTGPGKGFLYCYTYLNPGTLEIPLPDYRGRETRIGVDGEWVVTPNPQHWSWPSSFFEGDEYLYIEFNVSLS
jgi:hypothetical protein